MPEVSERASQRTSEEKVSMTTYSCHECGFKCSIVSTIPHNTDRKCFHCNMRMDAA